MTPNAGPIIIDVVFVDAAKQKTGNTGENGVIGRNVSRRLERLEGQLMPLIVRKVWQIMTISSDGTTAPSGRAVEWSSNPAPNRWQGIFPRRLDK